MLLDDKKNLCQVGKCHFVFLLQLAKSSREKIHSGEVYISEEVIKHNIPPTTATKKTRLKPNKCKLLQGKFHSHISGKSYYVSMGLIRDSYHANRNGNNKKTSLNEVYDPTCPITELMVHICRCGMTTPTYQAILTF